MKQFNNQFATQKLRENTVKFTIDNSDLYTAIMDKYMTAAGTPISDEGDYLETDLNTFDRIQDLAQSMGFESGVDYNYEIESDYIKRRQHPEYGKNTNDYFGTKIDEESATGGTATMTPGTGEQYATPKAFKKKDEVKDKEPKLAAGKAKVYMKDKWGWKDAPSVPNRPSKGGFIYKQLFESISELSTFERLILQAEKEGYIGKGGANQATIDSAKKIAKEFDLLKPQEKITLRDIYFKRFLKLSNLLGDKEYVKMNENYSKFRKETRTKTNEQQFHAAVRLAEKKISEANRILEYTAQLKSELSVIKENKNTQKLMERITRGIAEAYRKMKNLK